MAAETVPIRRQPLRYEVRIVPDLDKRGRCQAAVTLPSGEVIPGVIRLRQWDEEVFLHECIHALDQAGELHLPDDGEAVAQQISQGLYAMGWRLVDKPLTEREAAQPLDIEAPSDSGSCAADGGGS